jgi:hypothetical protein
MAKNFIGVDCPICEAHLTIGLDPEVTRSKGGVENVDAMRGRPSRCTPEFTAELLEFVAAAPVRSPAEIIDFCGVTKQTFDRIWIKGARAGREPYATFQRTCMDAYRSDVAAYSCLGQGLVFNSTDLRTG